VTGCFEDGSMLSWNVVFEIYFIVVEGPSPGSSVGTENVGRG